VDVEKINKIKEEPLITNRIKYLKEKGIELIFSKIESSNFQTNLELIDSQLPQIIAYMLLYRYTENKVSRINALTTLLHDKNPIDYNLKYGHPFYEYKIKNLLTDMALGMTPGKYGMVYIMLRGHYISKEDGDVLAIIFIIDMNFKNICLIIRD